MDQRPRRSWTFELGQPEASGGYQAFSLYIQTRLRVPVLVDPSFGTFRADLTPEVPWDHEQYSEHYTSAQQSAADPSFWMQQLYSTATDSIQDPQPDLSSLPRTSISQTDKQETASNARAEPIEDEEMGNAIPPSALMAIKNGSDGNLSPKEFLLVKLAELQASRMRLIEEKDEEIRAVEKTLSLM
ncbi:uncharacterized protein EAE97_000690 [Botrytis byssoidea]|uniref:Uncharacterized protein n=1 Tax=Botrytis byssoidea TaxID=139641 RepID=A0A9P5IZB5_9HELO|nr:uncharacterized protein EAE97_000690 [Botrytis byssoidea]KAF7955431.1 hypothetical protein EAE97_000690 [Botrytis byssoidea]